uniref:Uncharacterized protein n=1 Tax=Avena sativa TaxID=4498 RepID=A0ACD5W945_AVESA
MNCPLLVVFAFVLVATEIMPAPAAASASVAVRYHGVMRMSDGRWRGYITNKNDTTFGIGHFDTVEAAALAQDRAILALLGPDACSRVFNFHAGFSNTELRFLWGRHAPGSPSVIIGMIARGTYEPALTRFIERVYDAYMDPELALDVMAFRLFQREVLDRHMASTVDTAVAQAIERQSFVDSARNKATNMAWVRSFHQRRRLVGPTFEDENIWPPVLPLVNVDLGDNFSGNELIYLPHGSCYVDEMRLVGPKTEEENKQPSNVSSD